MKLNITTTGIEIVPEDKGYTNPDKRDTVFIERVLGLTKDGDSVKLVRKNNFRLSSIACHVTQKHNQ